MRTIARQLYDISTCDKDFRWLSGIKSEKSYRDTSLSTWVFKDKSTVSINRYGQYQVDERYMDSLPKREFSFRYNIKLDDSIDLTLFKVNKKC